MKLNIPRASIWPNKSWDTTDPDEMAEAEQWARTLIAESSERPLEGSVSDETPDNGTTTPDKPETDTQPELPKFMWPHKVTYDGQVMWRVFKARPPWYTYRTAADWPAPTNHEWSTTK